MFLSKIRDPGSAYTSGRKQLGLSLVLRCVSNSTSTLCTQDRHGPGENIRIIQSVGRRCWHPRTKFRAPTKTWGRAARKNGWRRKSLRDRGENSAASLSSTVGEMCNHVQEIFFFFSLGSDQTTGKSNEAARARTFPQVVANPGNSWGHPSISVEGSRGSVQSKALTLSVPGVGLIRLNPHLGVTFGARPGKILPAIGVA